MMILHSSCQLGADIMMALDDVVSSVNPSRERFEEATYRTTRWFDRCLSAHERPGDQNLFPIVQGGLDRELRAISLRQLMERDDRIPGYAIGGLAGGEDKESSGTSWTGARPRCLKTSQGT